MSLTPVSVSLSNGQKHKMALALKKREPCSIKLSAAELSGPLTINLMPRNLNRYRKAKAAGKGVTLHFSPKELRQIGSGIFDAIVSIGKNLLGKLPGMITKKAAPALLSGIADSVGKRLGNAGSQPQLTPEEMAMIQARRQRGSCACRGGILRNAGGTFTLPGQTRRVMAPRLTGSAIINGLKKLPAETQHRYNIPAVVSRLQTLNNDQMKRLEQEVSSQTSNLIPQIPYRKQSGGFINLLLPAVAPIIGSLVSKLFS